MEQPQQEEEEEEENPTDQNHRKKMGNLRDTIVAQLTALNPSKPITDDVVSLIEQRLQHIFPTPHTTPTHFPYDSMIRRAIVELNKEGGSSEEEISEFIKREYEGLPWGHVSLLSHHLRKLYVNGEILITGNRRYMIESINEEIENEVECRAQGLRIENEAKEEQIEVVEDRNVSHCGGRKLIVVCGLLARQRPKEKICDQEKVTDSYPAKISEVLELPIEPLRLEQQQKIEVSSSNRGPAELQVTTLEEITQKQQKSLPKGMETFHDMPTNSQEVKEEQPPELQKSEQLQELGMATMGACIKVPLDPLQLEVEKQAEPSTHSSIVPMDALDLEREQHQKLQNPEKYPQPNLSKTEDTVTTSSYVHMNSEPELPEPQAQQQQQQTQGQLKQKPLRIRIRGPSKPVSPTATTMEASLLFQHQHEQQQAPQHQGLKRRGPGRPPKLKKPDAKPVVAVLLSSDCQLHNVQPQQPQGQGRMESSNVKSDILLPSQHQGQQQKPQSRGRGRPPKLKSDSDTVNEDLLTSQNNSSNHSVEVGDGIPTSAEGFQKQ